MTIVEILNEYRSNDLDLKYKYGSLDDETKDKITALNQIFADDDLIKFTANQLKIVFLYYQKGMTAEQIAEEMDISTRTVYRKRDEGIRRLSQFFDE